ncbi:MAG: phosphate:Na+ symporter [Gammaproteobacteria bacterium]
MKLAVFHTLFNSIGIVLMLPMTRKLAAVLPARMRSGPRAVWRAAFLNDSALDLSDVALEAARRETLPLFSNVFAIIADGISVPRDLTLGRQPLPALVSSHHRVVAVDVDVRYEKMVKPLFGAIIEFISKAQRQTNDGSADDLATLSVICRHLVDAVKGTKHLRKNLSQYMNASNAQVRDQYDRIRLQLAQVLRAVGSLDANSGDALTALSFDDAKVEIMRIDDELNRQVTALIRDRRLLLNVATSIMNDSRYAYDVGMHLVEAVQLLSSLGNRAARAAVAEMALDVRDLRDMAGDS